MSASASTSTSLSSDSKPLAGEAVEATAAAA